MLAAEALFLAGMLVQAPKERWSAAWFWSASITLLGIAALLGGIDHGFIEPSGLSRAWIQRTTWLLLGAITFCLLQTIAAHFFSARSAHVISLVATAQLCLYCIAILTFDSFIVAVLNYAPAMLWFLFMNVVQLRTGKGNWQLITGTCLLFIASAVQAAGADVFAPVDHNGLYHLISMPALLLLYFGGRRLDTARPRSAHSRQSAA